MMEVKAENGEVVQKWSPSELASADKDKMASALQKLADDKKKRAGLFDQKRQQIEGQKKHVEDVFRQEVERVKKEGIKENPLKPFDLD